IAIAIGAGAQEMGEWVAIRTQRIALQVPRDIEMRVGTDALAAPVGEKMGERALLFGHGVGSAIAAGVEVEARLAVLPPAVTAEMLHRIERPLMHVGAVDEIVIRI